MPFTADQIIDRHKLKRQMVKWRFLVILLAVAFIIHFFLDEEMKVKRAVIDGDVIARAYIDGMILDDSERLDSLKEIAEDKNIKAVIIHVNSPGGTPVGGENLYNAILRVSQNKPVAIIMGDAATSAAYMLAVAGDYLVAHKSTITGSIGVIAQTFEVVDLAKKVGIQFHTFKSSPLKGGPLPTEELSEEMKHSMDVVIKDIYNTFFNMVLERRKIDAEQLRKLADGRIFTGVQALDNKLIDAIGDEETALEWFKSAKQISPSLKVKDYDLIKQPSRLDYLFESVHNISSLIKGMLNSKAIFS